MNIFITGSSGFVGKHLISELLEYHNNVTGYDIAEPGITDKFFEHINGDVCDREGLLDALSRKKYDVIIHLAAKHHDFGIKEEEYFAVNEGGTKNLCEAAGKHSINQLIFVSSVAVYGESDKPIFDNSLCLPDSFYGKSKLAGEKIVKKWYDDKKERSAFILRPAVIFGPYNYANMYHLINKVMSMKFIFVGSGKNIKSIAYIDNLINAILFLVNNLTKQRFDIFNYSDEPQLTIKQIVKKITFYGNVHLPKLVIPYSLAIILTWPLDLLEKITGKLIPITSKRIKKFNTATHFESKKIRKFGYNQSINLDKAFKETVDWFKNSNVSKGKMK